MAEKVRYYLEQSVPELEDLQKKGLFDKNEIKMIMRRRTDFEHRIQGRGSKPTDFLKYSDFESNLEKLRRKRFSRLNKAGVIDTRPSISDWAGVRRVLFIYDRAAKRYPGNLNIWARYLIFSKQNGAVKIVYKVYSKLLQLQPRNVDAWLSAANYEFVTNGNAKGARSLYQRGLRFNPTSLELWMAYSQFELTYVSKLLARRKVLGLITEQQQKDEMNKEEVKKKLSDNQIDFEDDEMKNDEIQLPSGEEFEDNLKHLPEADMNMLGNPETNPALRGDVALTAFDLCLTSLLTELDKEKDQGYIERTTISIVEKYLNLYDKFEILNRDHLYLHALEYLQRKYPDNVKTVFLDITLPIRSNNLLDPNFPDNLQLSVNKLIAYKVKSSDKIKYELSEMYVSYLSEKFLQSQSASNEKIKSLIEIIIQKCRSA